MKGVSLPINTLIIVVIGLVVLLGIAAMWFGGFSPFSSSVSVEGAKNDACSEEVRRGCGVNTYSIVVWNFDADNDGSVVAAEKVAEAGWPAACGGTDNLAQLCRCFYGRTTEASCRKLCGCP